MSLKNTLSTQHWNTIPKKCKNCSRAIYTIEGDEIHYQCSIYGSFKRDCILNADKRKLPKSEEILSGNLQNNKQNK